jgi:hypothetical protein
MLKDPEEYVAKVAREGRSIKEYEPGLTIHATNPPYIKGYKYTLVANPGADFDPQFKPALTPQEMLSLGVFEGKYLNDSYREFPAEWFIYAAALGKLSATPDPNINYFKIKSRQPLSVWRENGWAPSQGASHGSTGKKSILGSPTENPDERGWFQWYCRYWIGRRIPDLDRVQIGRWKAFARHAGQIRAHCRPGDLACRPKQRQGLLQWSYKYDI